MLYQNGKYSLKLKARIVKCIESIILRIMGGICGLACLIYDMEANK